MAIELKSVSPSAHHWTPRDALEHVLAEFDDPECDVDGLMIIRVKKGRHGVMTVSRVAAKLSFSEIIAALEMVKQKEMGQ